MVVRKNSIEISHYDRRSYNETLCKVAEQLASDVKAYGGNIAAMQWQTGNESVTRGFQFEYTPLGFLDWADYTQSGLPYAYDVYYYYDKNGNMTKDLNKRISSIQYNLLNLPQNITFSTGSTIAYTYDAAGRKLNVTYGTPAKTIEYCGNMIYEDGTLTQILTEGGYVTFSGSTPVHHAYLKDHQGNNRVVINSSGTIEQVNHYYPFGYFFGESTNSSTQRFKYNGKEFDEMHGLHWYDYGARHYDPAIMRFTTMDPMCEKYYHLSPYAYCGNNPVNAVDNDGRKMLFINGYLGFGSQYGDKRYWNVSFITGAKSFFDEKNEPYFVNFDYKLYDALLDRRKMGYQYAMEHYQEIIEGMDKEKDLFNITSVQRNLE